MSSLRVVAMIAVAFLTPQTSSRRDRARATTHADNEKPSAEAELLDEGMRKWIGYEVQSAPGGIGDNR